MSTKSDEAAARSSTERTSEGGSDVSDTDDDNNVDEGGEYGILLDTFQEDAAPLPDLVEVKFKSARGFSLKDLKGQSFYGHSLTNAQTLAEDFPPGDGGLVWYATIIPDEFVKDGKVLEGLNERDYNLETLEIKPRRPSLPVTQSDFLASLTKIDGSGANPRYIFDGVLNGWPGLKSFELISLDKKRKSTAFVTPRDFLTGQRTWVRKWKNDKAKGIEPKQALEQSSKDSTTAIYRAKLRTAPWGSDGWSKDSRGFVFWFESLHKSGPRLSYGTNMIDMVGDAKCTHLHMLSHRYATAKEAMKDKITYHSIVLLEWDHGQYCTIVEVAYLNGLGGYNGRCNWYDDKDEKITSLYAAFPPELISPWLTTHAEVRCHDVPSKNLDEFKEYVAKYTGDTKSDRFMDPHFHFSHPCRLTYATRSNIAQYLVNYMRRDTTYNELLRNCQTFAADFAALLAGKRGIAPFHPVNRIEYTNRTYLFLYNPDMYNTTKK